MKVGCIGVGQHVLTTLKQGGSVIRLLQLQSVSDIQQMGCDVVLIEASELDHQMKGVVECAALYQVPVIALYSTPPGNEDVKQVISAGAFDYFISTMPAAELVTKLERAARFGSPASELTRVASHPVFVTGAALISVEPLMRAVLEHAAKLSKSLASALLSGEPGTEKEQIARSIHSASWLAGQDFLIVDCASDNIAARLFGTGDPLCRLPYLAQRTTVYLEKVDAMPLPVQRDLHDGLLRGTCTPERNEPIICRLLSGTSADLDEYVREGRFLSELYADLAPVHIAIPPLRLRPNDIPLIARVLLDGLAKEKGLTPPSMSLEAQRALQRHSWPTNVHGLREVMSRALLACKGETLLVQHLGPEVNSPARERLRSLAAGTGR